MSVETRQLYTSVFMHYSVAHLNFGLGIPPIGAPAPNE